MYISIIRNQGYRKTNNFNFITLHLLRYVFDCGVYQYKREKCPESNKFISGVLTREYTQPGLKVYVTCNRRNGNDLFKKCIFGSVGILLIESTRRV